MPRSLRMFALIAAMTVGVCFVPPVRVGAQLTGPPAGQRSGGDMLADQLMLLMQQALRGDAMPTEDQLIRAQMLLDLAGKLSPRNPDLLLAQAELARLRNRPDERREALSRYLRLVPTDDAAQLQLILLRAGDTQTLDQRLTVLERLLDAESTRSLSSPLRSRLASMAASSAKELGQREVFVRRLKEALRLDSANGEAARMLYELAVQENASVTHLGAAAIAWVRAEPANHQARAILARLLLSQGVYDEATRQLGMAANLAPGLPEANVWRLWATSIAMLGQPDEALGLLRQAEGAQPPQEGPDGELQASPLPVDLQILRLAILTGTQQREGAQATWARLVERLQPLAGPQNPQVEYELAVASAVFGQEPDTAVARLSGRAPEPIRRIVQGWARVHAGEQEAARETLRPIADTEPFAALGMAALESDEAARAKLLDILRFQDPAGVAGMLAVLEMRRIRANLTPTPEGRGLRDYINRWPSRIWYTDLVWSPWLSMRLEIDPARAEYLTPIRGVATLRNHAGVPLSLGPNWTVPTRMIVALVPSSYGKILEPLPPMVVDAGRGLTIPEGGTLTVPFRLDYSALGELLATNPAEPIDFQCTAVLDPRPTASGGLRPGPVGAMDTNRAVHASLQAPSAENIEAWLAVGDAADPPARFDAIARLLHAAGSERVEDVLRKRVGSALAERFEEMDPAAQAWVVRFLPPPARRTEELNRISALAQRSTEPLVRITQLATQVKAVDDAALVAALREEVGPPAEFARALRASLREGPRTR